MHSPTLVDSVICMQKIYVCQLVQPIRNSSLCLKKVALLNLGHLNEAHHLFECSCSNKAIQPILCPYK